jgi:hypothetical protein
MTSLERLATTTHPAWAKMIDERRTPVRMTMPWDRTGGSHFKDGQFFKK